MQCEVIGNFYDTIERINRKGKVPKQFGVSMPLNKADIEFIDAVAAHPSSSATALAKVLGVTRGAVTQWGNRLEELGVIERAPVEGNRKTKHIVLTDLGEKVRAERERIHYEANVKMCRFLSGLKPSQLKAIMSFLEMASTLDISPFECIADCCATKGAGGCRA